MLSQYMRISQNETILLNKSNLGIQAEEYQDSEKEDKICIFTFNNGLWGWGDRKSVV